MFLAIDIGNTTVKFGVYDNKTLTRRFSIRTPRSLPAAEIYKSIKENLQIDISAVFISSVVTEVNDSFRQIFENFFHITPLFVDYTFNSGLKIEYRPPSALGIDRLIAAFAAIGKYGKPCIVCDFGTATTIDAVNLNGEFLGGVIVAGMNVLTDALFQQTSKLPKVEFEKPEMVIGNSTVACIQSGIYFGYAGLVENILRKMIEELGEEPKIIATGGLASKIAESTLMIQTIDENLYLKVYI